jgi:cytosine/adenosine deaminase-related metal-dependent hydrolase
MLLVHADAIVCGDSASIADGAIVVDDGGRIVDVGPAADVVPLHAGLRTVRVRGVVMPGLVNAHTHLELSALRGQVPGGSGFIRWVDHLIAVRTEQAPETDTAAIDEAVAELDAFGTAAVGEVSNSLAAVPALARHGLCGCVFHEVFGVMLDQVEERLARLPDIVRSRLGAWPDCELAYSATAHTLYTTHAEVVRRLVRAAGEAGARTSVHLCEHASERRFLERGDGPVVDWMTSRLGLARERLSWPGESPVVFADRLGALAPHVACVHLTDARPGELALVAERGAHAIFCPRSNLHIEVTLPPLMAARAAGLMPALGTDSLASSSSLDVLAEARALSQRFPMVPASELLCMATWNGARALGRSDVGRIAVGARPGLWAIDGEPGQDACNFILTHLGERRRWIVRRTGGQAP